ncbi:hypothetical protein ACGFIF_12240 [Kribbella sp. NPDC049174]|uniref:hypothetical protein n=1 Tax=Kribbella sp. NPDC049174 TaxID=3364112 RepID=UPI0037223264
MSKTASSGASWDHVDAGFPEVQVFANVLLSAYRTQTSEFFSGFQPSWAEAYIVTPQTPMTTIAGISFPTRRDNTVFLRTNFLTFWLQVSNGGSANRPTMASAVGIIYDLTPDAAFDLKSPAQQLSLAVHTEDGTVLGTHRSVRMDGGPELDEDEFRERVLAHAYGRTGREPGSLQLAAFDYDQMPRTDFRVNPSTGQTEPVGDPVELFRP